MDIVKKNNPRPVVGEISWPLLVAAQSPAPKFDNFPALRKHIAPARPATSLPL